MAYREHATLLSFENLLTYAKRSLSDIPQGHRKIRSILVPKTICGLPNHQRYKVIPFFREEGEGLVDTEWAKG